MSGSAILTIRPATLTDLPRARDLLAQLGYDLQEAEVRRRYESITSASDHALFIAAQDEVVAGLLHLYFRPALDKPPEVIVQALVVEETARGSGVGRKLMEFAELWALDRGSSSIALSSHISRFDAHAFYQRLGYQIGATSHLMRKLLTVDRRLASATLSGKAAP